MSNQVFKAGLSFYLDDNPTPKLRAMVARSVGIAPSQPVKPDTAAAVERGPSASEVGALVERAMLPVTRALDRLNAALDAPPVQRSATGQPESYDAFLRRAAVGTPGMGQAIPMPPTGAQPGAPRARVYRSQATTPAGAAVAAVNQSREGADPHLVVVNRQRKPGTVSVAEAVRRGMPARY